MNYPGKSAARDSILTRLWLNGYEQCAHKLPHSFRQH